MKRATIIAALLFILGLQSEQATAQFANRPPIIMAPSPIIRPPMPNVRAKISPAQAAAIAQRQSPGSKIVGVKLLPSGSYAVTLKSASSVTRIMISSHDGSVM